MNSILKSPFSPSDRMLRQFAALCILFFGLLAIRQALQGHERAALWLAVVSVTVGTLGLVRPRLIRPIFVGWMAVAYPIGWVVSRVILSVIFFGLITPIALVFRMTRRDALALRSQPGSPTYWSTKQPAANELQYLRQF